MKKDDLKNKVTREIIAKHQAHQDAWRQAEEEAAKNIIPKSDLIVGSWYRGHSQSRYKIAYWDGSKFHSYCLKFGHVAEKVMEHWDDGGCFGPEEFLVSW